MKIAEIFKSIQGEGVSTGRVCLFLRVAGCTLDCPKCDSAEVWKAGEQMTHSEILGKLNEVGGDFLSQSHGRIVLTGGSPMRVQKDLDVLLSLQPHWSEIRTLRVGSSFIEVETECMVVPNPSFDSWVNQYNVSPKVGSFGLGQPNINQKALRWHVENGRSFFKFVADGQTDLDMIHRFVESAGLMPYRVWIMPQASSRKELDCIGREVAEFCIDNQYNYSHRLQLSLWDKTTGV